MRLFIAINFDRKTKQLFSDMSNFLRAYSVSGTFPGKENYHITLAFLGECEKNDLIKIRRCMDGVSTGPFRIVSDRLGHFGTGAERLYWAGIMNEPRLQEAHASLSKSLRNEGFSLDNKAFKPHITLGRKIKLRSGFDPEQFKNRFLPVEYTATKISLMLSQRIGSGMTYTELYSKEL